MVDPGQDEWKMTHGGTISVGNLDVANHELSMLDLIRLDRLPVSTLETSCPAGQVLHLLGAAELVPECRSVPTPDLARE